MKFKESTKATIRTVAAIAQIIIGLMVVYLTLEQLGWL